MAEGVVSALLGRPSGQHLVGIATTLVSVAALIVVMLSGSIGVILAPAAVLGSIFIWSVFREPFIGLLLVFIMIFSGVAAGLEIPGGYLAMAAFASLAWVLDRIRKFDLSFQITKYQSAFICLWLSAMLISIPLSLNQKVSLLWMIGYVKVLVLFLLTINLLRTKRQLQLLLAVVVLILLLSFVYGLYSVLLGAEELATSGVSQQAVRRLQGLAADPNHFAASVLVFVPIPFLFFFAESRRMRKTLWLVLFGLLIAAIAISFSRGGLVSLGLLLLLLAIKERHRPLVIWSVLLAAALILIALPPDFWERFSFISNLRGEASARWRVRHAIAGFNYFLNNPVLGIGIGSYLAESTRYVPIQQPVHNMYLEVAAETGALGLMAFLGVIWTTVRCFEESRVIFRSTGDRNFALLSEGLKFGFYSFLITGLFLSIQMDVLFWSQLGLAGALRVLADKNQLPTAGRSGQSLSWPLHN